MRPGRLVQELGIRREAAEVVPLLHRQRLADEPLTLDQDHAPQVGPLLPALQPVDLRRGPAPAAFVPTMPLGPLPVVADALTLPPVGPGPVEERNDPVEEVLVIAFQGQQVVGLALADGAGDLLL